MEATMAMYVCKGEASACCMALNYQKVLIKREHVIASVASKLKLEVNSLGKVLHLVMYVSYITGIHCV